ncbi:MAG: DUF1801 domain-containing protein [Anaerolineales bacterium]|nr:DUF1801 domain-containing protein [Anaerolineales bacterium]
MNIRKTISEELEDFLSNYTPEVRNLALALRDLVFEIEPRVKEQIDFKASLLGYGYRETYKHIICVIILYSEYVNLGFPRGVDLADPEGLLEGTGKYARHVKMRELAQIESAEVAALLQGAVEITPYPGDEGE